MCLAVANPNVNQKQRSMPFKCTQLSSFSIDLHVHICNDSHKQICPVTETLKCDTEKTNTFEPIFIFLLPYFSQSDTDKWKPFKPFLHRELKLLLLHLGLCTQYVRKISAFFYPPIPPVRIPYAEARPILVVHTQLANPSPLQILPMCFQQDIVEYLFM